MADNTTQARNLTLWNNSLDRNTPVFEGIDFNSAEIKEKMRRAASEFNLDDHSTRVEPFKTTIPDAVLSRVLRDCMFD